MVNVSGGALEFEAIINSKGFQQQIDQIQAQLKGLTNAAGEETRAIETLARKATGLLGAYASGAFVQGFVKDIVRVRGEFQQLEVAFETMLGSKAKSDKLMAEITEFAATTPFELEDVAKATKQLLAFGIGADKIKTTLRSLGDVSAGIGAPLGEIAYLFGTIKTQGVALTQDVRQFAQRGIPIYDELAKVLKVSTEEVGNLITAGKVGFPEIEKVFQSLTAEGSKFGGLMEKQSQTLTGQLSNLSDAWSRMLNEIGQSGEGVFSDVIKGAISLVDNYKAVIDILVVLSATYGTYKAVLLATTVVQAIQEKMAVQAALSATTLNTAQKLQAVGVLTLQKAYKGLQAGMSFLASPAALLSGVAAIGAGLYLLRQKIEVVKTAQDLLSDAVKDAGETFSKQEVEIKSYVETLGNQNIAESVRLEAYNKLKSIAPEIIGQLTFQAAKTADLTDATNTYVAALKQRILFESKQSKYAEALKQQQDKFDKVQKLEKEGKTQSGNNIASTNVFESFTNAVVSNLNGSVLQGGLSEYETATAEYRQATETVIDVEKDLQIGLGTTKDAIKLQIQSLESQNKLLSKTGLAYKQNEDKINSLKRSLENYNTTASVSPTNKILIDNAASLDALKSVRAKIEEAYTAETNAATKKQLAQDLKYADQRKKILDPYSSFKDGAKALKQEEKEYDKLLEQRKTLLERIEAVKRDAKQSGLIKEQSEIDKTNEKYDVLIQNIEEHNRKIEEQNKKNRTPLNKVGLLSVTDVEAARAEELRNVNLKQQADKFQENLEIQKKIFEQYEEAKKQIGIEKADEMFKAQTKGFTSYGDFLRNEFAKMLPKITLGIGNVGDKQKFEALMKSLGAYTAKTTDDNLKNLAAVMQKTTDFAQARKDIEKQYNEDVKTLEANQTLFTKEELEKRRALLKQSKDQELTDLNNQAIRQSEIYRLMGQDLILSSESKLKEISKEITKTLDDGFLIDADGNKKFLTPEMVDNLTQGRDKIDGMLDKSQKVSAVFKNLSTLAHNFNNELGDVLGTLGDMVIASKDVKKNLDAYNTAKNKKDDKGNKATDVLGEIGAIVGIAGAIGSVVGAIAGIFSKSAEERRKREQELRDFNARVYDGELQINELHRERARLQLEAYQLTIQRIEKEKELLQQQQAGVKQDFNKVLAELQGQTAQVLGKQVIFAIGSSRQELNDAFTQSLLAQGKTLEEIRSQFADKSDMLINVSLQGLDFNQLEDMFIKGQLQGRAKELFETLQKLKQEGLDVDKALQEANNKQKEILTGTTASSITDAIVDGFSNGLSSVQDFAGTFESLMKKSILNSLKFKYLEEPLAKFFEEFSSSAASNGGLSSEEVKQLNEKFNLIIDTANGQFQQLQQLSGLDLNSPTSANANSLQGAVKNITEESAQLLAGQFGGLRMTAAEGLAIAKQQLDKLNAIQFNTAETVAELKNQTSTMINFFRVEGVKLK
jgi:hypothetical protein